MTPSGSIRRTVRTYADTEVAAMNVIAAIKKSEGLLPSFSEQECRMAVIYSRLGNGEILGVTGKFPDPDHPHRNVAVVTFLLKRSESTQGDSTYEVMDGDAVRIFKSTDGRTSFTKALFVRNVRYDGDDFVVPLETPDDDIVHLMGASVEERQAWLACNPYQKQDLTEGYRIISAA